MVIFGAVAEFRSYNERRRAEVKALRRGRTQQAATEGNVLRTAETILKLHKDTLSLIEGGQKFLRDDPVKGTFDVTDEIRARCQQEILACEELIKLIEDSRAADPKPSEITSSRLAEVMGASPLEKSGLEPASEA